MNEMHKPLKASVNKTSECTLIVVLKEGYRLNISSQPIN